MAGRDYIAHLILTYDDRATPKLNKTRDAAGGVSGALSKLGGWGKTAALAYGALSLAAGGGVLALAKHGAEVDNEYRALASLVGGMDNAEAMMNIAAKTTGNLASKQEMLPPIMRLVNMGLISNADDTEKVIKMTGKMAGIAVKTVPEAVDALVNALMSGNTMGLRPFGLSSEFLNKRMKELAEQFPDMAKKDRMWIAVQEQLNSIIMESVDKGWTFADSMQRMRNFAKDLTDDLSRKLVPSLDQFGRMMESIFPIIEEMALAAASRLVPAFDTFMTTITEGVRRFVTSGAMGVLGDILLSIFESWVRTFNVLMPILERFIERMTLALGPVFKALIPVVEALVIGAFNLLGVALDWIATGAERLAPYLLQLIGHFGSLGETVGGKLNPVFDRLKEVWGRFWDSLPEVIQRAKEFIAPIFDRIMFWVRDLADKMGPLLEQAKRAWESFWGAVQSIDVGPTLQKILIFIVDVLGQIISGIVSFATRVLQFIGDHKEELTTIFRSTWNVIKGIIDFILPIIQGVIKTAMAIINGDWKGAWEAIKETFRGIIDKLPELLRTLLGNLPGVLVAALGLLVTLILGKKIDIHSAFSGIWDKFKGLLSNGVQGARDKLGEWLGGLRDKIGEWKDTIRNKFSEIWQNLSGKISEVAGNIKETIGGWLQGAWDKLGEWKETIRLKFGEIWQNLTSKIGEVAGNIRETVGGWLQGAWDKMEEVKGSIQAKFGEIWQGFSTKFSETIGDIKLWIGNHLQGAWDKMEEVKGSIQAKFGEIWAGFKGRFDGAIGDIKEWLRLHLQGAWDKMEEMKASLQAKFGEIWQGFRGKFDETLGDVKEWLRLHLQGAWDKMEEMKGSIQAKFGEIWQGFKGRFDSAIGDVKEWVRVHLQGAWDKLEEMKGGIQAKFGEIWQGFTQRFSDTVGDIKLQIGNHLQGAKDKMEEMKGGIQEKFGEIWSGFSDKISGAWNTVRTTLGDRLQDLWQTIEDRKSGIQNKFGEIWNGFKGKLDDLMPQVSDTLHRWLGSPETGGGLWSIVERAKGGIHSVWETTVSGLKNVMDNTFPGVAEKLGTWLGNENTKGGLWKIWSDARLGALGLYTNCVDRLKEVMDQHFPGVKDKLTTWLGNEENKGGLWGVFNSARDAFHRVFGGACEGLGGIIEDKFPGVTEKLKTAFDGLIGGAASKLGVGVAGQGFSTIAENLAAPGTLTGIFKGAFTGMAGSTPFLVGLVGAAIIGGLTLLGVDWGDWWDNLKRTWDEEIWPGLNGVADGGMKTIKGTVKAGSGLIRGDWDEFDEGLQTAWQGCCETMDSIARVGFGILDATVGEILRQLGINVDLSWDNIKRNVIFWINDLALKMANAFNNICRDTVNQFIDIGNGIIDALNGAVEPFRKFVNAIVGGINWVLEKLGIDTIPTWDEEAGIGHIAPFTYNIINTSGIEAARNAALADLEASRAATANTSAAVPGQPTPGRPSWPDIGRTDMGMATGGTVKAPGWAVIGERGPEIMKFAQGDMVFSNREMNKLIKDAGVRTRGLDLSGFSQEPGKSPQVSGALGGFGENVNNLGGIWDTIKNTFDNVVGWFKDRASDLGQWVSKGVSWLLDKMWNVVGLDRPKLPEGFFGMAGFGFADAIASFIKDKIRQWLAEIISAITQAQSQAYLSAGTMGFEYWQMIQRYFPEDQWLNAYRVMLGESMANPSAIGDAGSSIGLFQIRWDFPGRPSKEQLLDPEFNVKYAAQLWRSEGWRPWTVAGVLGLVPGWHPNYSIPDWIRTVGPPGPPPGFQGQTLGGMFKLIQKYWPESQWVNAFRVMMGASQGDPKFDATVGEGAAGLFRLRWNIPGSPSKEQLMDAETNIKEAARRFAISGWRDESLYPWANSLGLTGTPLPGWAATPWLQNLDPYKILAQEAAATTVDMVAGHPTGVTINPNPGLYGYPIPVANFVRTYDFHPGYSAIDYSTGMGTPIYAVADAIVRTAGWSDVGYGNMVFLKHLTDAYSSLYAHMSQILVSVGQHVARGQTIGLVGSTGNSTGPHLHFEVRGFRKGGSFTTNGAELILVGDNPSGREQVTVTPVGTAGHAPRSRDGGTTINYNLEYNAYRKEPGEADAARAMRELEMYARMAR